MKRSRLSVIILSMIAAIAAGAILIGTISYFVLATRAEPTPVQGRSQVVPTNPATPDNQYPSILESDSIQVIEGEEHESGESEEHEREEHEFGERESGEDDD